MSADAKAASPTVTIKLSGGLGNQLFQYAAARALALRTHGELVLDASFFDTGRHRALELDVFPIAGNIIHGGARPARLSRLANALGKTFAGIASRHVTRYREPHFHYDPAFTTLEPPVELTGYFQSPRYFDACADMIRRELTPPSPTDAESLALANQMRDQQATALHIRRGDYVTSPKASRIYHACSIDYYARALAEIPGDSTVYVFSDDIPWARDNLTARQPLVFVGEKTPRTGLADLWLMTQAHHHIIANSTFSWWGAWLAGEDKGFTVAPSQWFRDPDINDRDLIPEEWRRF